MNLHKVKAKVLAHYISPNLRRHLIQKAMSYCEMWPLENKWALREFSVICTLLGVELAAYGDKVFLTPN